MHEIYLELQYTNNPWKRVNKYIIIILAKELHYIIFVITWLNNEKLEGIPQHILGKNDNLLIVMH